MSLFGGMRERQRNDLILVGTFSDSNVYPILIHHVDIDEANQRYTLHGKEIYQWIDFWTPEAQSSDFITRFKAEPDPNVALAMLKEEVTEPYLKSLDAALQAYEGSLSAQVSQLASPGIAKDLFRLETAIEHMDFVIFHPSPGAIRKGMLGRCPFGCNKGDTVDKNTILQKWPHILDDMPEGSMEKLQQNAHPPCPGCLGIDCFRKHIKLQLEIDQQVAAHTEGPWPAGVVELKGELHRNKKTRKQQCGYPVSDIVGPPTLPGITYDWTATIIEDENSDFYYPPWPVQPIYPGQQGLNGHFAPAFAIPSPPHNPFAQGQALPVHTPPQHPAAYAAPKPKEKRSDLIAKLPNAPYELWLASQERVGKDICVICKFCPYEKGEEVIGLPCEHFFHKDCLTPWLEQFDDCPTCRRKLAVFEQKSRFASAIGVPSGLTPPQMQIQVLGEVPPSIQAQSVGIGEQGNAGQGQGGVLLVSNAMPMSPIDESVIPTEAIVTLGDAATGQ